MLLGSGALSQEALLSVLHPFSPALIAVCKPRELRGKIWRISGRREGVIYIRIIIPLCVFPLSVIKLERSVETSYITFP